MQRVKRRAAFVANPYQFSKRLRNKEIRYICQQCRRNARVHQISTPKYKQTPQGDCLRIEDEQPPSTQFDVSAAKLSKIVVKKAKS